MRSERLETVECDGWRLRVEFHWHADRFRHVVSLIEDGGNSVPLLESIEGSPAEDWPASPPLQSLHCEALPDGSRVALLVGMAGRGHWSASIGPRANDNRLVFDMACRASQFSGSVGTSYRLAKGVAIACSARDVIRLLTAGKTLELMTSQEQATRSEIAVSDNAELRIEPADVSAAISTRRWLYEIRVIG